MKVSKKMEKGLKQIEEKIERLKQAERELNDLNAPLEVFGSDIEPIRAKLRIPSRVDEVERELSQLKARVAEYKGRTKPELAVDLLEKTFQAGVWKAVDFSIVNQGNAHARGISITFSPEVETRWVKSITELNAGSRDTLRVSLKAKEEGDIPLAVEISYKDMDQREYRDSKSFWLSVKAKPAAEAMFEIPGYTVMEKLGAGGFADVYKAERKDGLVVAIKVPRLTPGQTFEPTGFLKEAELWNKLSHPHIVKVYEYGARPYPWIAMENMDGGSLKSRLGRLRLEESLDIIIKLSQALFYASHLGVIHRDIKPENILFDHANTPKLTDWGLGKVLLEASRSVDGFKGTLAYSAPEQLSISKFGAVDWRTDIYQLGAVLYELITGEWIFAGVDAGATVTNILNEEARAPSELNPSIPKEVDAIALRMLTKRKEDRYQDVSLVIEHLETTLRGIKG